MTVVRRLARPMLAAMFIDGGLDALRHPRPKVAKAEPVVHKLAGPLHLPDDPELLVRANGAAMVGAGAPARRRAVPPAQRAWSWPRRWCRRPLRDTGSGRSRTRSQKRNQRIHFLKNLGLLGGILLAAVDTGGKPGMPWRARRAAKDAARAAHTARREAKLGAKAAKAQARLAAKQAVDAVPFTD